MGRQTSRGREAPNLSRARDALHRLIGDGGNRKAAPLTRKSRRKLKRTEKKSGRASGGKAGTSTELQSQSMMAASKEQVNTSSHHDQVKSARPISGGKKQSTGGGAGGMTFGKQSLDYANRFEDREIKRLEKQMKLKKRGNKLPQIFADDGLDCLVEMCEGVSSASGQSKATGARHSGSELDKYVEEKRQTAARRSGSSHKNTESAIDSDDVIEGDDDLADDGGDGSDFGEIDSDEDMAMEDFDEEDDSGDDYGATDEDDDELPDAASTHRRGVVKTEASPSSAANVDEENGKSRHPTAAAATGGTGAGKYIPPALRQKLEASKHSSSSGAAGRDDSAHQQALLSSPLMRQVTGLINRLCEGTLKGTVMKLQQLYTTHSRNDTNVCLSASILLACMTPALQPDRLLAEHMLLVAVLHRLVDTNVGCHFLELLVKQFDSLHNLSKPPSSSDGSMSEKQGKQCDNVVVLLAHLYVFKVAHCSLIFAVIRKLLERFHDDDITMLLLLLKTCGGDIRKDDPLALKDVVSAVKGKSADATYVDESRMRFMLDSLVAVCHNNIRKIPGYDPDSLQHRSRVLRGLLPGSVALAEAQMNVSYEDLTSVEEKGRWWVVGSAWTGRSPHSTNSSSDKQKTKSASQSDLRGNAGVLDDELLKLAREQHLNTDLRRNIFGILMTCDDVVDAFQKLLHLHLKGQQEREIVHVVLHCCLQEKKFNIFYACLCEKLAAYNRSHQMTMRFALWDKLKSLSSMKRRQAGVLRKLMIHLLMKKSLTLALLKNVDFSSLDPSSLSFFEEFFLQIVCDYPPESFQRLVEKSSVPPPPHLAVFLRFVSHQVKEGIVQIPSNWKAKDVRKELESIGQACRSYSKPT